MELDNVTRKQRSKALKDFEEWAIRNDDQKLIHSLFSLPKQNSLVNPKDYRIPSSELSTLRGAGNNLQKAIYSIVEIHNNELSDTDPDDYMWDIHYKSQLSESRNLIKEAIPVCQPEPIHFLSGIMYISG